MQWNTSANRAAHYAKEYAKLNYYTSISSAHVLAGLCGEDHHGVGSALFKIDVHCYKILEKTNEYFRKIEAGAFEKDFGGDYQKRDLPWTPAAVLITDWASIEAQDIGHLQVEAEHLLLAICKLADFSNTYLRFAVVDVIRELNIDVKRMKEVALQLLKQNKY